MDFVDAIEDAERQVDELIDRIAMGASIDEQRLRIITMVAIGTWSEYMKGVKYRKNERSITIPAKKEWNP